MTDAAPAVFRGLRWQLSMSATRYADGSAEQAVLEAVGDWLRADTDQLLAAYLAERIPPRAITHH
jgi:hypothetical protein